MAQSPKSDDQVVHIDELPHVVDSTVKGALLGNTVVEIPHEPSNENTTENTPEDTSKLDLPASKTCKVGNFISTRIEELGVQDYFIVPGDTNMQLLDCLLENKRLRMVPCCNELNTGYAADGYARSSSVHLAVVVVAYNVGGLSILNAISGACSERLKIIVLSGCPNTSVLADDQFLHHTPSAKNRDQALNAFRGVTATSIRLQSAAAAVDEFDRAIAQCLDKSLPVYIEVPNDIVGETCLAAGPTSRKLGMGHEPGRTNEAVESFQKVWNLAKRPILVVGKHTRECLSRAEIQSFAEKLGCPVFSMPDGRQMPEMHPQYCGLYWPCMLTSVRQDLMEDSDLWVVLGGVWSDVHATKSCIDKERPRMMSLHPDRIEAPDGRCIGPLDLHSLVADLMVSEVKLKDRLFSLDMKQPEAKHNPDPACLDVLLTQDHIFQSLQTFLTSDDTIVADTGETWFATTHITLPPGADCLLQLPYGSIGWSLPAALGSQVAHSKGRVVLMVGDGSFQMTAQELSTMIRVRINPVVMVFNNLGYKTETAVHDGPYNYIANWDYAQIASSMAAKPHVWPYNPFNKDEGAVEPAVFAVKVKTQRDLLLAFERAKAEPEKLAFLECCIHPDDMTQELRQMGSRLAELMGKETDSGYASSVSELPNVRDGKLDPNRELLASKLFITHTTKPRTVPNSHSSSGLRRQVYTDHMVQAHWTIDGGWSDPEIVPHAPIPLTSTKRAYPLTQHDEGLKAYRGADGKLRLLQLEDDWGHVFSTGEEHELPQFDPDELLKLVDNLLELDAPKWLPADNLRSCLRIRPTLVCSTEGSAPAAPSKALLYVVMSSGDEAPVTNGSSMQLKTSIHLRTQLEDMMKQSAESIGHVKIPNGSQSVAPQKQTLRHGYDQVLRLHGREGRITEASTESFFLLWVTRYGKLELITPPLGKKGMLSGLVRSSVLALARERLTRRPIIEDRPDGKQGFVEPIVVCENDVTIDEIVAAADENRLRGGFTVGADGGITSVASIGHEDRVIMLPLDLFSIVSMLQKWINDVVYGKEESGWARVVEG